MLKAIMGKGLIRIIRVIIILISWRYVHPKNQQ